MAQVPGDSGHELDGGVPHEVVAAVSELRGWATALPGDDDPRDPGLPRRDVAYAVVDALHRRLLREGGSPFEVITSLVESETDVLRAIDDVRTARDAVHRRIVLTLPAALAFQAVEELNDIVDQVLREVTDDALRHLHIDAFTDVLTGASNRRAFERDLHRALEISRRHNRQLAVVIMDLDGLKQLNDEYGHAAGDRALRDLAAAFQGHLRAGDAVYRIGGDEFALVLPESGAEAVDALLARASATAPSFSHGWAAHPVDGDTVTELLERADERLFQGRHVRRAALVQAEPAPEPEPGGGRLQAAATAPVVLALVIAELVRRIAGVDLGSVLAPSWIGLLLLGGLLGPPVARRWCGGHADLTATAVCAMRVGMVVLLILVLALVPVNRVRNAIETAAELRERQLAEGPGPGPASRRPRSPGPAAANPTEPLAPSEFAAPPLASGTAPTASSTRSPSTGGTQLIIPSTPSATPGFSLIPPAVPDLVVFPVPVVQPPTSGKDGDTPDSTTPDTKGPGTKLPGGEADTRTFDLREAKKKPQGNGPPHPHRPGKTPVVARVVKKALAAVRGGGPSHAAKHHGH